MFMPKEYCRYGESKCRHLKIRGATGICKKKSRQRAYIGEFCLPQAIPKSGNIKAPKWCPKIKH